ncbi:DUF2521 family protein [Bacillus andreraoultii]|uniref:DUF2521 family protein n=1 Tax=Bacillus andreraoultii TaxID=1499685 RepID=UPI00067EE0BC|nr:DUF2521 family protein [Bacillus andreraoultii]
MNTDINTNIDTTFMKRRREQQMKFERSVLRELSIETLKKSVRQFFGVIESNVDGNFDQAVEEGCYDVALEVYLLGSSYSRLGYYGKPLEEVMETAQEERGNFAKALHDFIEFWGAPEKNNESLKYKCDQFVDHWFREGFTKGKMKYKMRLH